MIVIDVNLLIYAYDSATPEHAKARMWLEDVLSGSDLIGLPWLAVWAFLRVLTYPGQAGERLNMQTAVEIVQQWLEMPNVRLLNPGDRHWAILRDVLESGGVRGKLTSDAALAALTMEYGGVLHTNDRDFARFPGLRWVNPLAAS
ncbi:type II toxin-antitoxin system VapC family toxin [Terracidiphilus gabretensis]|jgi:toxin-antitoxin system PIN domain toxin|uniref:type II toxin-antitoxin system VapC family toxin n=1 Tax=Terracidiphilus gabretensis TaxID=1577687 RepID=UPI00071B8C4F|nr:type II toxin-antitoxin system VapC family toxin [Terracidiphilus gabretensis]